MQGLIIEIDSPSCHALIPAGVHGGCLCAPGTRLARTDTCERCPTAWSTAWGCGEHPHEAGARCSGRGTGLGWLWSILGSEEEASGCGCPQGAACMDESVEAPAGNIFFPSMLGRKQREAAGWRGLSARLEGAAEWGLNWALGSCGVQMGRRKGAVPRSPLLGGVASPAFCSAPGAGVVALVLVERPHLATTCNLRSTNCHSLQPCTSWLGGAEPSAKQRDGGRHPQSWGPALGKGQRWRGAGRELVGRCERDRDDLLCQLRGCEVLP